MLQPSTIKFLTDLKKNNDKSWFEANRDKYESAKADFESFVQGLIDKLGKNDPGIAALKAKGCMFRINRDVRFSKDKSPYKTNMGASINRGGKKSPLATYYVHIEPGGNSFAGGGMWMPEAENLKKVRQEIDYNFKEWQKILSDKDFKKTFGDLSRSEEYTLKREPKGYEKDNPAIEDLKLKSFVASVPLTDDDLVSKDLKATVVMAFETLKPVLDFVNRAVEG